MFPSLPQMFPRLPELGFVTHVPKLGGCGHSLLIWREWTFIPPLVGEGFMNPTHHLSIMDLFVKIGSLFTLPTFTSWEGVILHD